MMHVKEMRRNIGLVILPIISKTICNTLKLKVVYEKPFSPEANYVFMFWHGTMTSPWYFNKNKNFSGVVSPSKDGEILSRTLESWNYKLIRGSSNAEPKNVMKEMVDCLIIGKNLAITPDGPRGERLKMKIGGLIASVRTGKEIYLCGAAYSKKFTFNSWDKFEYPLPFSKSVLVISERYKFENNLTRENYEEIRLMLENRLNEVQKKAEEICESN